MSKPSSRSWVRSLFSRRFVAAPTSRRRVRLKVELFEDRTVPSASIPLNGFTWTHMGPAPIFPGQTSGLPSDTGRINSVAVDPQTAPTAPDVIYVASDSGGIWRTIDGGATWSPRTDQQQVFMQW